jgi:dTDP-4-dehydrorhamnose 3,5-epimerase
MRFIPAELPGAFVIELEPFNDERGLFARTWCREELTERGLVAELAQCSISRNTRAGTLRGLHFQRAPHEEAKIIRCTRGAIFDVIVDLRLDSAAHGTWAGF